MRYIHHYRSPIGDITMASDGTSLTGLWFDGQKYFPDLTAGYTEADLPVFDDTVRWLDLYFSGHEPGFTPAIELDTTEFRRDVWEILRAIPYGETMTYGEIAARIAERKGMKTMSAQAVGGAVGHNPVSLIIPCHRVVGAGGNLTGYAGGVDKKRYLLGLEASGSAD